MIKRIVRRMAKKIIPLRLYTKLTGDYYKEELEQVTKDIFKNKDLLKQYSEEIAYLKKEGGLTIFPYSFCEKYRQLKIKVYHDEKSGLNYVLHHKEKLFFPRSWEKVQIRNYYIGLLMEQDIDSPHRYFTDGFHVDEGDIFVDVGCAEGMSSLECVEKAGKIYLFECNEEWREALKMTFSPWADKVHIISKYARSYSDWESVTLDEALKESFGNPFFIKLDLDGYEWDVLSGAPQLLNTQKIKCVGCTYHHQEDESVLNYHLQKNGFSCEYSKGYMLFLLSELVYPYFRRGLIRAKNF